MLPSLFRLLLTAALVIPPVTVHAEEVSPLRVEAPDLGVVHTYATGRTTIRIQNTQASDIRVTKIVSASADREVVSSQPIVIKRGATVEVPLQIDTGNRAGLFARGFEVHVEGVDAPAATFVLRGFADWLVDAGPLKVDFGPFDTGKPVEKSLELSLRPGATLKATRVEKQGRFVEASIDPSGRKIILRTKSSDHWGLFEDMIEVRTDSPIQPKFAVRVSGEARGDVVASASFINFEVVREGERPERLVRLEDRTGKPLRLGAVSSEGSPMDSDFRDCTPKAASCKLLRLSLPQQPLSKQIAGAVKVEVPDYRAALAVNFVGVSLAKDEAITDLEEEAKRQASNPNMSALFKDAVAKQAEMAVPEGDGPLLTWSVTGDRGLFGFEVYRGDSDAGPFQRVSPDFIRSISNSNTAGGVYRWRDASAKKGGTYWYYIGIVYQNGIKSALTSPQKVVAKAAAPAAQ